MSDKTYSLEFELPGLPTGMNNIGGKRLWQKKKEKEKWQLAVAQVTAGKRPPTPLKRAVLTCTRYSYRAPDYEGLVTGFKHVIDGLVVCGIIEDDSMDHIGKPTFNWERAPMKQGKIKVRVESMEKEIKGK